MTLTETKARIRQAKRLIHEWRTAYNDVSRGSGSAHRPAGLNLSAADFDAFEWGMSNLQKAWLYDIDDEGKRIPGTGVLTRLRGCIFTKDDETMNFMFKGIPVRCAEPVGFVWS